MKISSEECICSADLCDLVSISANQLSELVEYGVIDPSEGLSGEWNFSIQVISTVKRAIRLQQDFDIDTASTALVIDLLDELEQLRTDNKMLKNRLNRFLQK
jgi:chaperone modulatory protein CbpM